MKRNHRWVLAAAAAMATLFAWSLSAQAGGKGAMSKQERYVLDPQSWVRVGIDYDGDGRMEHHQHILGYDLIQALERTRELAATGMQGRQQRLGHPRGYYPEKRGHAPGREYGWRGRARAMRMDRVEGSIRNLKSVSLAGMEEEHRIARVLTPEGRIARVDLGPEGNLTGLDLQQGDRIRIHGTRGTIDERPYLMARRIQARGQDVTVVRPRNLHIERFSGKILQVRTASFRRQDVPDQIMARVRLDKGITTIVNLGTRNQLRNELDMSIRSLEGENVEIVAHRARVGNRTALVADQLRVGDQLVSIDWYGTSPHVERRVGRR